MITEVETAILDRITARIAGLGSAGIQKDARGKLVNPVVAVSCLGGRFARAGQVNWRQDLDITILVQFKNLQNEQERRKGANPLAQGIVQLLLNYQPTVASLPLNPVRWRDTTTDELYQQGIIEYLIEFSTAVVLYPESDETVTDLLRIGLNYYLQPDDGAVDAQDMVEVLGQ